MGRTRGRVDGEGVKVLSLVCPSPIFLRLSKFYCYRRMDWEPRMPPYRQTNDDLYQHIIELHPLVSPPAHYDRSRSTSHTS